jgi:tetratricopeptide (TPR) repeat protein
VSNDFTNYIEQQAVQLTPPPEGAITDTMRENYYFAIDKANEYSGHPQVLVDAIRLFQTTTSTPLFYAGMAYVHMHAAYKQGFTYSPLGLSVARQWLQRAQHLVLDITELLIVQAFLAIRAGRDYEAQQALTRLQERNIDNIHILMAKMEYYGLKKNVPQIITTYQNILTRPITSSQLIYVQNRVARYYTLFGEPSRALNIYQDIIKVTPRDPWVWHNMSIIYLQRWSFLKAHRCNKSALQIMDFVAARRVRRQLIMNYVQLPLWGIIIGAIIFVYVAQALGY